MRSCNNCIHGSYSLDCNTGVETLYCKESEYEYEVQANDACEVHQFIDGMEEEKNFLLCDESYLGGGYIITHTRDGHIDKFLKLYIMNDNGFPHYGLRVFSVDGRDNPEDEFNNIEFTFRSMEDYDNGLYEVFSTLAKKYNKEILTIDEIQQGRNNISIQFGDKGIIKLIISKDIYRGKQHSTDFIDINLGDNYSCSNYDVINTLYNELAKLLPRTATSEDVKSLIKLKIK